jgi:hypothetical protein
VQAGAPEAAVIQSLTLELQLKHAEIERLARELNEFIAAREALSREKAEILGREARLKAILEEKEQSLLDREAVIVRLRQNEMLLNEQVHRLSRKSGEPASGEKGKNPSFPEEDTSALKAALHQQENQYRFIRHQLIYLQKEYRRQKLDEMREAPRAAKPNLKLRINAESVYRGNSSYRCLIWMIEFIGPSCFRIHFDSTYVFSRIKPDLTLHFVYSGDGSLGQVQDPLRVHMIWHFPFLNPFQSRLVVLNQLGRAEDADLDSVPQLFSSGFDVKKKTRVLGHLDFFCPAFLQHCSYAFIYGASGTVLCRLSHRTHYSCRLLGGLLV